MAIVPIAARDHGAAQDAVVNRLREAGALRRNRAQPLTNLSASHRRQVDRFVDRGVIRRTPAGCYYLDPDALSDFRGNQLRIVFSVLIVVAGVIAGILLTSA